MKKRCLLLPSSLLSHLNAPQFSPPATLKQTKALHRQRILDISQRATSLILSIIILVVMANAYRTFLANKNVTAGGQAIYPTFMALWPTYMMIAAGAVTVVLNACVVFWRVRGHIKDEKREEMYNKAWDYLLHGINVSFTKYFFPVRFPYTISSFALSRSPWYALFRIRRVRRDWRPNSDIYSVAYGLLPAPLSMLLRIWEEQLIRMRFGGIRAVLPRRNWTSSFRRLSNSMCNVKYKYVSLFPVCGAWRKDWWT